MLLSENSSREEILGYIEKYPFYFLYYYPDKPWTQPYLDEVAKKVAKINPEHFLENLADKFPQGINIALFALGNKNVTK